MEKEKAVHRFGIIKHFNTPNEAVTVDGYTVKRKNKLFFKEWGTFVMCAPYDNHFIYDDPVARKGKYGRWTPMCTCGSPAGKVGSNVYSFQASPATEGTIKGEMIVCLHHSMFGKHADGSS